MTDVTVSATVPAPSTAAEPVPPAVAAPPAARARRYDRTIIEGPLRSAVWKLAWPTMLANVIGGIQGMIDHILVGNLVGYTGNAAIGVSWQIFLVVIVFMASLFTGMSVLVARYVGAGNEEMADKAVYQAFITAAFLSLVVLAPLGYVAAPVLLRMVSAAPVVQAEALPFLRIMFVCSSGMMIFFMLGGALRSAGDARTPMVLGVGMTLLNIALDIVFIRGFGPIRSFGTTGAAIGTSIASGIIGLYSLFKLWHGGWVVRFPRGQGWGADWSIIRNLFRFGLPTGFQGIAMNIGGMLLLAFIGSLAQGAAAQAAYAIAYTQLFSLITWTSQGLLGATAAVAGQNLGAKQADRAEAAVHTAARFGLAAAVVVGAAFFLIPRALLAVFGMHYPADAAVISIGVQLLRVLSVSGLLITLALTYTGGLQGTGDTKSPMYISIVSQIAVPLGICFVIKTTSTLQPIHVWSAILAGHATRCGLSVWRFRQGKWRGITV
jgi:putative MATE family efflux protein